MQGCRNHPFGPVAKTQLEELPLTLLDAIPDAERNAVLRWWAEFAGADRQQVVEMCDERWEECFFGPSVECDAPPVVLGGCFLPHDDAWRFADWEGDWREYLTDHSGDIRGDDSVMIAAQFRSRCFLDGSGVRCHLAEWSRTRFESWELPPSEQNVGTSDDRGATT